MTPPEPYDQLRGAPPTLSRLVHDIAQLSGVEAVALGGSRAAGTHTEDSDWDIGVYYRGDFRPADVRGLGHAGTVAEIGEWGGGVFNGGARLRLDETKVDSLWRDLDVVDHEIAEARAGRWRVEPLMFHLTGIPTYLLLSPSWLGTRCCTVNSCDRTTRCRCGPSLVAAGRVERSSRSTTQPPTQCADALLLVSAWSPSERPSSLTLPQRPQDGGSPMTRTSSSKAGWVVSTTWCVTWPLPLPEDSRNWCPPPSSWDGRLWRVQERTGGSTRRLPGRSAQLRTAEHRGRRLRVGDCRLGSTSPPPRSALLDARGDRRLEEAGRLRLPALVDVPHPCSV